tara:strand:+ start:310 stop:594 length:285 start_codon:yes stop_codon:yes gene_type:complete
MKKVFIYTIILFFTLTLKVLSDDKQCNDFKKYSIDYMKCKTNQLKIKTLETGKKIKDKTVSTSKNIIKDTKEYQSKEWSEEKEKINKIKEKVFD